MDHRGEQEWKVPLLFKNNGTASSLALRHQPYNSPSLLIDPLSHWRSIAFQPTKYLLPSPNSTVPITPYIPLTSLASGEIIPHGQTPQPLINLCQDKYFCHDPAESAASIIAIRHKAFVKYVENVRLHCIASVAFHTGSQIHHITPSSPTLHPTFPCRLCDRPSTTIFHLRTPYMEPSPTHLTGQLNPTPPAVTTLLQVASRVIQTILSARGTSPQSRILAKHITDHIISTGTLVCYPCAIPAIRAAHTASTSLINLNPTIDPILTDLRRIAATSTSIIPTLDLNLATYFPFLPWQVSPLVNSKIRDPKTFQLGKVICHAPSRENVNSLPVFHVLLSPPNSHRFPHISPKQDPIHQCVEWTTQNVENGIKLLTTRPPTTTSYDADSDSEPETEHTPNNFTQNNLNQPPHNTTPISPLQPPTPIPPPPIIEPIAPLAASHRAAHLQSVLLAQYPSYSIIACSEDTVLTRNPDTNAINSWTINQTGVLTEKESMNLSSHR